MASLSTDSRDRDCLLRLSRGSESSRAVQEDDGLRQLRCVVKPVTRRVLVLDIF